MKPPAFQFYADDFLAGTLLMSYEERGLYITMLCIQWSRGHVSPDDMARLSTAIAQPLASHVLAKFKQGEDGNFRNDRMEHERAKQDEFRANRSKSGKAGADKRWHSHSTAIAQPMAKHSSPSPSPSPYIEREQADFPEVVIPTQAEVLEWAKMDGIGEDAAKAFFAHYDSKNLWVNKYGRAIDARKSLKVWANNEPRFAAKAAPQGNGTHSKVAPTVFNLKSIIEAKMEQANGLKARWAAEGPLTTDWSSEQAKQDYLKLRKEIKELKTKLATTPV
jgi:uncharacterized protein YdaU (DUF1376 family)